MVWLVFPPEQQVEIYLPDQDVRVVTVGDQSDGEAVLTGFSLPVANIFPRNKIT